MGKVPDYNLRAINKYNSKFDRIAVNLPKGTKERIKELTGESCNAYLSKLALADLDRIESHKKSKVYLSGAGSQEAERLPFPDVEQ